MTTLRGHWQLIALTALVLLLWNTPALFPAKMLVIFLHEFSHGLAAWLTGGAVRELSLSPMQGGHAITTGGSPFWIVSAGYLGSLFFGILFFLLALRTNLDRIALGALGALLILVTLIYMSGVFPILYGVLTGAVFLAVAYFLSHDLNDLILRALGLINMIYVPYDIFSDTLARSQARSDARILSEIVGGPTVFWGAIWLILSVISIIACLRIGLRSGTNISLENLARRAKRPSA